MSICRPHGVKVWEESVYLYLMNFAMKDDEVEAGEHSGVKGRRRMNS